MLIDGHAHLYPGVDRGAYLLTAVANLTAAARRAGLDDRRCALLLTQAPQETGFDDLHAGRGVPPGWQVLPLPDDPLAVQLCGPDAQDIVLVAGRQIVTAERLEVLAIGFRPDPVNGQGLDGQPLDRIITALHTAGRPAILPWGAGKWLGARGTRITALVANGLPPGVFLGDNAGRPVGWPTPAVFAAGGPVLPGSDPLPFPGAWRDIGRYGFHLDAKIDPARPAQSICAAIMGLTRPPTIIGQRVGLAGFAYRQIKLRMS